MYHTHSYVNESFEKSKYDGNYWYIDCIIFISCYDTFTINDPKFDFHMVCTLYSKLTRQLMKINTAIRILNYFMSC